MTALTRFVDAHKKTLGLFLSIGALSAAAYFSSFTLLWKLAKINYQYAVSIAYMLSVIVHFTGNRNLTFKSYGHNIFGQISKYLVMVAINYFITLLVMRMIVEFMHASPYFGIVCSIAATISTGYLMSTFWIFKPLLK